MARRVTADLNECGIAPRDPTDLRAGRPDPADALVRDYGPAPGQHLHSWRAETDAGEAVHATVVRDGERSWTAVERATVEWPVAGLRRWTIPDNWDHRVRADRETRREGIWHVPESDLHARVVVPTHCTAPDACYRVVAVGDLAAEPVGDLPSARDVRRAAGDAAADTSLGLVGATGDLFARAADHWDAVEEDLRRAAEWVAGEGVRRKCDGDHPARADEDWTLEFRTRAFRPVEALAHAGVDVDAVEAPRTVLREEVGLPPGDRFCLGVDATDDMETVVRGLTEAGATPAAAVDYHAVECAGETQSSWGDHRGISQPSVSDNVADAERALAPGRDDLGADD